jgi:hypothetical protein
MLWIDKSWHFIEYFSTLNFFTTGTTFLRDNSSRENLTQAGLDRRVLSEFCLLLCQCMHVAWLSAVFLSGSRSMKWLRPLLHDLSSCRNIWSSQLHFYLHIYSHRFVHLIKVCFLGCKKLPVPTGNFLARVLLVFGNSKNISNNTTRNMSNEFCKFFFQN